MVSRHCCCCFDLIVIVVVVNVEGGIERDGGASLLILSAVP